MSEIRRDRRRMLRIAITLSFLLGVPVALIVARVGSGHPQADRQNGNKKSEINPPHERRGVNPKPGPAVSALDAALLKTIEAGNYDLTFGFGPEGNPYATSGSGLANLDPQALSVNVQPRCVGKVTARIDGTHAWLIIGGTSDPAGPPTSAGRPWPTYDLVSFQHISNECFGPLLGSLATIEMASPEGMLALSQQAIATAEPIGTATVNGAPATEYQVGIDPTGLLQQPGSTDSENQAIELALGEIGDSKMTATVDVDAAGYIVAMVLAVAFPAMTETHTVVLSNFGDAGTIQLPTVSVQPGELGVGCRGATCSPPPSGSRGGGSSYTPSMSTTVRPIRPNRRRFGRRA